MHNMYEYQKLKFGKTRDLNRKYKTLLFCLKKKYYIRNSDY